jgi:hypothetical protein
MNTQLPILECTSCGSMIGHLLDKYYKHTEILMENHEALLNTAIELSAPEGLDEYWDNFYVHYYTWARGSATPEKQELTPRALVAHCLLYYKTHEDEPLPAGFFPINAGAPTAVRICCMRSLHCDNSRAPY